MAGFGANASGTGNMADDMAKDAKELSKTAKNTAKAAVKDAKAVKKAAGQIASGNYLGAAKTAIENPMTLLKVALVALGILCLPLFLVITCAVFLIEFPSAIVESVQSAITESVDSITLGWEDFKAELSNGIDNFISILTTGKESDYSQAYRDDLAIANDPNFYGYTGTSNMMVAVLNNYFRKAYTEYNEKAVKKAEKKLKELTEQAKSEGISEEHIYTSIDPEIYDEKNYLNWTFYIMAGESCQSKNESGMHFHIKDMIAAAKKMKKEKLWKVDVTNSYKPDEGTRMWYEPEDVEVEDTDENGNPLKDKNGNVITHTETRQVQHTEKYKYVVIKVTYKYSPAAGARKYILDEFGITDEKENDNDMSDVEVFDEQVAALRALYNAKEALFEDNASLDYDPNSPVAGNGGGIYSMVISSSLSQLISQFYASHPADTLFDAPAVIGGPWSGWKEHIRSPLGEVRDGVAHNGTDIDTLKVQREFYAPSQGIIVSVQDGYANGDTQYNGNAQRGNFVFVYYGESSSGGVFVLYQHLTPGIKWRAGDTIPEGEPIARTGWSGLCKSSHKGGTGEHLHLEEYFGTIPVNPYYNMGS